MARDVVILVGSLRNESFSRKVAQALIKAAPDGLNFRFVEIGDLPLFNQDLESTPPAQWVRFRDEIRPADAVLFVTPEYNRSVPGALKNAIDIGSRPYGHSVFNAKPAAVVSVTPGGLGAFGANHHLRQSLAFLNMPTLQGPEAYISNVAALFDGDDDDKDAATRDFFVKLMSAFAEWVEKAR